MSTRCALAAALFLGVLVGGCGGGSHHEQQVDAASGRVLARARSP